MTETPMGMENGKTKIPGLQSSAVCVGCGDRADTFCSGCRVTPYCSAACQRRDWLSRHKKVCHNLKRQAGDADQSRPEPEPEPVVPAPAPLRRPRSPDAGRRDSGSDRMPPRRFGPPGSATAPTPVAAAARGGNRGSHGGQPADNRGRLNRSIDGDDGPNTRSNDRPRNDRDKNDGDRNDRPRNDKDRNDRLRNDRDRNDRPRNDEDRNDRPRNDRNRNQDNRNSGYGRQKSQDGNRQFTKPSAGADNRAPAQDEDWGPAPAKPQEPKPQAAQKAEPAATAKPAPAPSAPAPRLATVADVAPVPPRKLTPANCVVELLSEGETFLLSVDATGESCRGGPGFVCTTVLFAGPHADNYVQLIDPLKDACEAAEPVQPRPGDLFAYRDPSDESWYRARCLGPGLAALLDASRLAEFSQKDRCSRLPREFSNIPEYCCLLDCGKVKLTDTPECTLVSKSGGKVTVSLATESGAVTATARRWLPAVDAAPAPAPAPAASPASAPAPAAAKAPAIVELPRPPVTNNSLVMLMDATDPERVFVVPAHKDKLQEFNDIACEVAVYAADPKVPRLRELPTQGQTVIARFTDGMDYRAFVKRVSSKHKRCLLEYIEYGNIHIEDKLENMCACPPELDARARPTPACMVTLQMKPKSFTDAAKAYLDTLKEEAYELKLTIPSGAESGPTGTAVRLAIVKTGEDVNRKVETLSTPQWLLHLERGGDVLEIESVHFNDIEYVDPTSGELVILDTSMLSTGSVYGHSRQAAHAHRALELTRMLEEYCNSDLAKDPYLPKLEELCIAKCPKKNQWLRAVVLEQQGGPGAPTAMLQFFDYGYLETVPVSSLRKMMPEFVRGVPAAVTNLEIKDFPENPTPEQISRAERHMRIAADGSGALTATRVTRAQLGEYIIEAPDLIRAMQ